MKRCLPLICLLVLFVNSLNAFRGRPLILPRSQSVNAARELVGWEELIDLVNGGKLRGIISVTPTYNRSFRPCDIAEYLFCSSCLVFSGSRVENRGTNDILADYFGLPTDFRSIMTFEPRANTFLVDFNFYTSLSCRTIYKGNSCYCGIGDWTRGFYLRIQAPLVYTRWDLNPCECDIAEGELDYPAGYMSNELISRKSLPQNAQNALSGCVTYGDMQTPLKYGKLSCKTLTKTRLSDVRIGLGYNIFVGDYHHGGIALRVAVPTGNTPESEFLFEPVVGNGGHWELGVGLTGHYTFWESQDSIQTLGLYLDANIMHLFKKKQKRSFDFCKNNCGSRYILIEEIGNPLVQNITVDSVAIEKQYHGKIMPAINQTTLDANIGIGVQADIICKLGYTHDNWAADIGYNFWIRSKEKLDCREKFPDNCFAIKGDGQLYGFDVPQIVGLNATQSCATLNAGQGDGSASDNFINANADNAGLAAFGINPLLQTNAASLINTGVSALDQVNGSNKPIILCDNDINNCSALVPQVHSHKLFIHGSYRWMDVKTAIPYIGLGFEAEWAGRDEINRGTFSQWGIWLKGGIAY